MDKLKFKEFTLPEKILNQLYELTGGPEAYKGFKIAYSDENATPIIYTNCDSQITESGLIRSIENYLSEHSNTNFEITDDA